MRQAFYSGALGARGINELISYADTQTAYDNNVYTVTSTYYGGSGNFTMYITHPTPSKRPIRSAYFHMTRPN